MLPKPFGVGNFSAKGFHAFGEVGGDLDKGFAAHDIGSVYYYFIIYQYIRSQNP